MGSICILRTLDSRSTISLNSYGSEQRWEDLERWGKRIIALAATPAFQEDREIRLEEAHTASNAILNPVKGGSQTSGAWHTWFDRLALVARDSPSNPEIQNIAAQAGVSYAAQFAPGWP